MPENKHEESFLRKLMVNALYTSMLVAVLIYLVEKYFIHPITDSQEDKKSKHNLVPIQFLYYMIPIVLLIVTLFFYKMVEESKQYQKEAKVTKPVQKSFTNRISKEDYSKLTEEITRKEIEKLKQNPKFREMINQKGNNPANWVWQTQEKEKRTVWKEENDDDVENLSDITLSD